MAVIEHERNIEERSIASAILYVMIGLPLFIFGAGLAVYSMPDIIHKHDGQAGSFAVMMFSAFGLPGLWCIHRAICYVLGTAKRINGPLNIPVLMTIIIAGTVFDLLEDHHPDAPYLQTPFYILLTLVFISPVLVWIWQRLTTSE